jgi:uncharacterized membrane protein (UPF0182 family)
VLARIGFTVAGGVLGALLVYALTLPVDRRNSTARFWPEAAGAFFGALLGYDNWNTILMFLNRTAAGIEDPILNRDGGFYMFTLPFLDAAYTFLMTIAVISLIAALASTFLRISREDVELDLPSRRRSYLPVHVAVAAVMAVFALGQYLNRFHLLTSRLGIVAGAGWTDVHIRMPGFAIVSWLALIGAVLILIPKARELVNGPAIRKTGTEKAEIAAPLTAVAVIALVWIVVLGIAPAMMQWLRVEPNEITMERDYIEHNIRFTRYGFQMNDMQEREFAAEDEFSKELAERNRGLMSEVRLWDWRALKDVYEQFQEIRLYYQFPDVDIDRYTIGDDYRQVMVSPREMDTSNLPEGSRTFVNQRFKYTHGYGLTLSSVSEFTPEGLPHLLIKDIPPVAEHPSLKVSRPEIYYGTLTRSHVVANSKEKEFDYPRGDRNVYANYQGEGGVRLAGLWRKFVFGWMFDGTRFFLSSYPTAESRVMFHRHILRRARRLAPFLELENDPYIVLHEGRLLWIIDAYTTSPRFPYSEPFAGRERIPGRKDRFNRPLTRQVAPQFRGQNYVRNSVKVVVDAYNGDVSFYVYEEDDPVINVWRRVFPDLFKSKSEMPEGLRDHVRYPATWLLTQGLVYAKYHMTDPAVFYNQEDLWVRATEKYYQQVQQVEPYYVMWKMPGTTEPQFILMLPFTPKNKQVMIGWMAGMCDGENYGRLLAYKFPKEKRVLGPQQVETKIDQDRDLSGQLTLWDQRGSKVIRGNVLAIPIEKTLLYVEPIYLQAETAAYPELRVVALMHQDNLSYAPTFEEALQGLFQPEEKGPEIQERTREGEQVVETSADMIKRANNAFESYLQLQNQRKFGKAADKLEELSSVLEKLSKQSRQ